MSEGGRLKMVHIWPVEWNHVH